jgi:hypothetical protein
VATRSVLAGCRDDATVAAGAPPFLDSAAGDFALLAIDATDAMNFCPGLDLDAMLSDTHNYIYLVFLTHQFFISFIFFTQLSERERDFAENHSANIFAFASLKS